MDQIGFKIRQKVSFYNIAKKWKKEQNGTKRYTKRFKKVQKLKWYKTVQKWCNKVPKGTKGTKGYKKVRKCRRCYRI